MKSVWPSSMVIFFLELFLQKGHGSFGSLVNYFNKQESIPVGCILTVWQQG